MSRREVFRRFPEWTVRIEDYRGGGGLPVCQPGVLNSVSRQIYLQGQTAFLALALHDKTGGQIWGALCRRQKNGQPSQIPGHFAVETEPGLVTDIDGTRPLPAWQNYYGGRAIYFTRDQLRSWQRNYQPTRQWMGPVRSHQAQYRLAESFVDLLLRT